jgi:hypothetical protein
VHEPIASAVLQNDRGLYYRNDPTCLLRLSRDA